MDRLDAMSVLLAAVESGSLSKASRKLRQPLATVSRKVTELEAYLNATLLIRSAKGLELTPAGRSYVAGARTILEQLSEVERTAAGEYTEPKGDLVVTAPIMFGRLHVLPVVTRFLEAFPDVAVKLVLTDRVTHFLDDQVDVALRIGELPDSSLMATGLGTVRRVMCASPAYLTTRGIPETLEDLAGHSVISFDSVSSPSTWIFEIVRRRGGRCLQCAPERKYDRCGDRCRACWNWTHSRRFISGCRLRARPSPCDRAQSLRAIAETRASDLRQTEPPPVENARLHRLCRASPARTTSPGGALAVISW